MLEFPKPKETLLAHGLYAKRQFGQNFLADRQLVERIAGLVGEESCQAVEIGAGLGGLTCALLNRGHQVTAIERDRDMLPVLRSVASSAIESGQLTLVEADAKTTDFLAHLPGQERRYILGNLPYNITGPLIQKTVTIAPEIQGAVFLVQLEVAQRLCAKPSTSEYGALSVFCQAAFRTRRELVVRRGAFYPQPNVDSAVVSFEPLRPPRAQETETFRSVVKAAFAKRRKTLRNAWKGLLGLDSELISEAAQRAGIALEQRGETLEVEAFQTMANELELLR